MADYAVTGKKGAGKSLFCVGLVRDALRSGKRVATNLNIHLDVLFGPACRFTYTRLPDQPTAEDLHALGRGQEGVVEEDNGIIILDETSTFFNARAFGDKERQPLLDWLVHSRKHGWDVYYICQGLTQVDKQLRESQIEYVVNVKNTKKWPIPFLTPLFKIVGFNLRLPAGHFGIVRQGIDRDALVVDRKFYRGKDLYPAYETQQIFLPRGHSLASGLHTVLSPWHTRGRYLGHIPPRYLRFLYGLIGYDWAARAVAPPKPPAKPKHPLVAQLMHLPPDQRIKHCHRLQALGAL